MKILDAYDLTGSLRDAGELAGCSHHTVKHYVERRAAAGELDKSAARPQLIDEYLKNPDPLEEKVVFKDVNYFMMTPKIPKDLTCLDGCRLQEVVS